MTVHANPVSVNGVEIPADLINSEVQYHPAASLAEARYEAVRSLVVRELLLQRAIALGLASRVTAMANPDSVIDQLLKQELRTLEPTTQECQTYYQNNRTRFLTQPVYEVSHILYLAPPDHAQAREQAQRRAQETLDLLKLKPSMFGEIARRDSACSSSGNEGHLGQITPGQTLPEFEAALVQMQPGTLCAAPVATEVGYHVIKLHHLAPGEQLPFDVVSQWVADHLRAQVWKRELSQYVQILAGQAEIAGFKLQGADSPLVQ